MIKIRTTDFISVQKIIRSEISTVRFVSEKGINNHLRSSCPDTATRFGEIAITERKGSRDAMVTGKSLLVLNKP